VSITIGTYWGKTCRRKRLRGREISRNGERDGREMEQEKKKRGM
jgi:hypothetical protein